LEQAFEGTLVEPLGNGRPDLLQRIKPYSAIGLSIEDRSTRQGWVRGSGGGLPIS
jgi:hypothetical protein